MAHYTPKQKPGKRVGKGFPRKQKHGVAEFLAHRDDWMESFDDSPEPANRLPLTPPGLGFKPSPQKSTTRLVNAEDEPYKPQPRRDSAKVAAMKRKYKSLPAQEKAGPKKLGTFKTKFERTGQRTFKTVGEQERPGTLEVTEPPKFR